MPRLLPALVAAVALVPGASAADLVLAADGKSDYQIVVPDAAPSPAVAAALAQTARLVQVAFKANGADVPVVAEADRDPAWPAILLGDTAAARRNKVDVSKLAGWGYVHKVAGRDVILAGRDHPSPGANAKPGGRPLSWVRVATAKAVADFLRRYAGVRFLYPDLPPWTPVAAAGKIDFLTSPAFEFLKSPRIAVPADLDARHTPALDYHISYPHTAGFYDLANNRFPIVDEAIGVHTYAEAVPPEKYKESHPEYFALVGGQRITDGVSQYCISNPAVRELIFRHMIDTIDRGYQGVGLGQPDGFRACQCDGCKQLYGTGGDWSEKLWLFHRDLAERVSKERPGKKVTILSYILTELPPKSYQKFPDNVAILLTGTDESDIAPWRAAVPPRGFGGSVYNWCPNLGTRYTPMRTPRYVEAQARRLAANNIRSIYRDGTGVLFGLEGPVHYTMGRMFDDPESNRAKPLVAEFCEAAFGKAAGPMGGFYDRLYHAVELYSEFLGTRNPAWVYHTIHGQRRKYVTDPFQLLGFLYTPTVLAELEGHLAAAEKAADTDKARTRLALVRREFDYLKALAKVVHLHHAFQAQPDRPSRDRLLDAVDSRNAMIAGYFDARGRSALPTAGWAYTLFPPPGHDAAHMRLAHDGYQEPYSRTPLNWDTKAMRAAPLPGTKRLTLSRTAGPVTLDAAAWQTATAAPLDTLPAGAAVGRKTAFRMLAGPTHLYVRIEAERPAGPKPPADAVSLSIAPVGGRDVAYRFTVGPAAADKRDAALNLVAGPLDPRYGQFDPDWSGEWGYESRVDPAAGRWLGLLAIPYQTLGVPAPGPAAVWRGNVSRVTATGPTAERAIWSASPSAKGTDDPADFGELAFPAE